MTGSGGASPGRATRHVNPDTRSGNSTTRTFSPFSFEQLGHVGDGVDAQLPRVAHVVGKLLGIRNRTELPWPIERTLPSRTVEFECRLDLQVALDPLEHFGLDVRAIARAGVRKGRTMKKRFTEAQIVGFYRCFPADLTARRKHSGVLTPLTDGCPPSGACFLARTDFSRH